MMASSTPFEFAAEHAQEARHALARHAVHAEGEVVEHARRKLYKVWQVEQRLLRGDRLDSAVELREHEVAEFRGACCLQEGEVHVPHVELEVTHLGRQVATRVVQRRDAADPHVRVQDRRAQVLGDLDVGPVDLAPGFARCSDRFVVLAVEPFDVRFPGHEDCYFGGIHLNRLLPVQ